MNPRQLYVAAGGKANRRPWMDKLERKLNAYGILVQSATCKPLGAHSAVYEVEMHSGVRADRLVDFVTRLLGFPVTRWADKKGDGNNVVYLLVEQGAAPGPSRAQAALLLLLLLLAAALLEAPYCYALVIPFVATGAMWQQRHGTPPPDAYLV